MYPATVKSMNIHCGCERDLVANTKQNTHVGMRDRQTDRQMDIQKGWERMVTWNTKAGDRERDITREKELAVATRGLCGEINMAIPAAVFADTAETRQNEEERSIK
jgi:hypothetical protein